MDLKDFVKATVQSIHDAVTELSAENEGMQVNPASDTCAGLNDYSTFYNGFVPTTEIDFDVAVTETYADKAGGKAGIKVLPFSVEGGGEVTNGSQNHSRVAFKVRVALPATLASKKEERKIPEFVPPSIV